MQDERAAIVVSAEQPPVTIFTVIDFSLVIGHLGLRAEVINHDPDSFHAKSRSLCGAPKRPQTGYCCEANLLCYNEPSKSGAEVG